MRNWNRREFTRNAGLLALFSPFVSLLEPSVAKAQAGAARYLLIINTNGTDPGLWQPPGAGRYSQMNEPLGRANSDIIMANRFDSNGSAGNHGSIGALTGTGSYGSQVRSLDHFVADGLRSQGVVTQLPSLHLGGVSGQQGVSFRNNSLQVPTFSLSAGFGLIFDSVAAPPPPPDPGNQAPAPPPGPSDTEIRLMRRLSVLDSIRGELAQLRQGLGGIEGQKLELHADSIRQLEERIGQSLAQARAANPQNTGGGVVEPDPGPQLVAPVAGCQRPGNLPGNLQPVENSAMHLELAISAFACDITRVALVEFGHHQATNVDLPGSRGDWHNDFMHSGQRQQDLINLERWLSDRFVDTIERLKSTPAPGGGSLFDQTYVLWSREMGDAVVHRGDNMPYVISGRAGGYLRNGGTYIQGGGSSHQGVLLSAAEAMGVTNFGAFGTGSGQPFGQFRG